MSVGRVAIVMVVGVAAVLLASRFLQGWVERRFGLAAGAAWTVAMAALAPVWVAVRLLGWMRPIVDEDERRRWAEAAIVRNRKWRRWGVLLLGFILVMLVAPLLGLPGRAAWDGAGAIDPILLATMAVSLVLGFLPSLGEPLGEADARDQALRGEATRLGYVVLLGLGVVAAAASGQWPAAGAQCWGPALVASLLASQLRMMVAPRGPGWRGWVGGWRRGGVEAEVDAPREIAEMSGWRVTAVVGSYFALGGLAVVVQGPLEWGFGVPVWLTYGVVVVGGVLLVTGATWRAGWAVSILGEEARRRAAERSVLRERRWRPWLIAFCLLAMLPYLASLIGALDGLALGVSDWSNALVLSCFVTSSAQQVLPTRGEVLGAVDSRDQADRRGATRVGYVMALVLGVGAAAVAGRWPLAGAQCWGLVLLASVLVAQVWMMMLSWQPGAAVPAGAD